MRRREEVRRGRRKRKVRRRACGRLREQDMTNAGRKHAVRAHGGERTLKLMRKTPSRRQVALYVALQGERMVG